MNLLLLQIDIVNDTIKQASNANEIIVEEKTLSILELITSGGTGGNLIMIALALLSIVSVYLFLSDSTPLNAPVIRIHPFLVVLKNMWKTTI